MGNDNRVDSLKTLIYYTGMCRGKHTVTQYFAEWLNFGHVTKHDIK